MATQYTRQTAVPCTLAEITSNPWIQNDGLVPSGVRTDRGMISRASILGVIIEKQESGAFILDDGTKVINVRSFDPTPIPVYAQVGDIVLVIGRPREYSGERYLVLEICKKIRNSAWIQYRKKELTLLTATQTTTHTPQMFSNDLKKSVVAPAMTKHATSNDNNDTRETTVVTTQHLPLDNPSIGAVLETTQANPFERIVSRIRELDAGNGADTEEVLQGMIHNDASTFLRTLIEEGEVFEIKPGRLKVLE